LYSLYPFFVAIWLTLDKQYPSRLTLLRIALATAAVILLTNVPQSPADPVGVFMMIGAALLYALHLPINQRVLFEVPAPTVTLYTLLAMSIVVLPAYLLFDRTWPASTTPLAPLLALTLATFMSRLSLFLGIKKIGGMQTRSHAVAGRSRTGAQLNSRPRRETGRSQTQPGRLVLVDPFPRYAPRSVGAFSAVVSRPGPHRYRPCHNLIVALVDVAGAAHAHHAVHQQREFSQFVPQAADERPQYLGRLALRSIVSLNQKHQLAMRKHLPRILHQNP
jgi:hypothetical protein